MQSEVEEPAKKEQKKRSVRKITKSYLQNSGLYYLQRFATSEGHFKTVMRRKIDRSMKEHEGLDLSECLTWLDDVAASFVDAGYIDDLRYAKGLVDSLQLKGKSLNQIKARLKQAQISAELIDKTISAHMASIAENIDEVPSNWPQRSSNVVEYISALKCAKKRRIGPFSALAREEKPHDKALAILARNGFSYEIAQTILQTQYDEAETFLLYLRSIL